MLDHFRLGSEADFGEPSPERLLCPQKQTFQSFPINVRFVPITVVAPWEIEMGLDNRAVRVRLDVPHRPRLPLWRWV